MPIYSIKAPNGMIYDVQAPEGTDEKTLFGYVQQQLDQEVLDQERRRQTGFLDTLKGSVARGVGELGSTFTDVIPAAVGSALGFQGYAKEQMEEAKKKREEREAKYPTLFRSYKEIEGIGDLGKYATEAVGEQLANIATSLVPGVGLGGFVGRRAATAIAKEIGEEVTKKKLTGEAATQYELQRLKELAPQLAQSKSRAQAAGIYLGSYAQNAPEVFQNIFEETGQLAPGAAAIFGSVAAALDAVLPATLAKQLTAPAKASIVEKVLEKSGMDKGLVRSVTAGVLGGVGKEGVTEGAQEAISIAAERFVDDNPGVFGSKEWNRIVESAIKGAVAGGAFGGAGGGVEGLRARAETKRKEAEEARKLGDEERANKLNAEVAEAEAQLAKLQQEAQMTLPGVEPVGPYSPTEPFGPPVPPKETKQPKVKQAEMFTAEGALTPEMEKIAAKDQKSLEKQQKEQEEQFREAQQKLKTRLEEMTPPKNLVSLAQTPPALQQTVLQAQQDLDALAQKRAGKAPAPAAPQAAPTPAAPPVAPTKTEQAAPTPPAAPAPVTLETIQKIDDPVAFGKLLGIGRTARVLRADGPLAGLDVSTLEGATAAKQVLEAYAGGNRSGKIATAVSNYITTRLDPVIAKGAPSATRPDQQPSGAGAGVPSERVVVPPAGTVKSAESSRVDTTGSDVSELTRGEEAQPVAVAPEVQRAVDFVQSVEAGGIPLNPAKIRTIAQDLGLEVKKSARPEETIQRIREAVGRATATPSLAPEVTPAPAPKPAAPKKAAPKEKQKPLKEPTAERWNAMEDRIAFEELTPEVKELADQANRAGALNADMIEKLYKQDKRNKSATKRVVKDKPLREQLEKVSAADKARLEKHYGAQENTTAFLERLKADVITAANKGIQAVDQAIRRIIKKIAEGVLSVAVVFNPVGLQANLDYTLPPQLKSRVVTTQEIRATLPTDLANNVTPQVRQVYEAVAPQMAKTGKGFMIADKQGGMLYAFNPDGSVITKTSALYGKDVGDVMQKVNGQWTKVTPAGKYTLQVQTSPEYEGGKIFSLLETDIPGDGIVAVHAVYLGDPAERRLARLASQDVSAKRISYGCINTSNESFLNELLPNASQLDGGAIFVLPEQSVAADMFPAETKTTVTETTETIQEAKERGGAPTYGMGERKGAPGRAATRRRREVGDFIEEVQEAKTLGEALILARANATPAAKVLIDGLLKLPNAVAAKFSARRTGKPETGLYEAKTHTVSLFEGASLYTLLHEAVHAATVNSLVTHIGEREHIATPADPFRKFYGKTDTGRQLVKLFEAAQKAIKDRKLNAGFHYGMTDMYEFVSEAFTDRDFQTLLASIPYESPKKTMFDKFTALVKNMLGLSKDDAKISSLFDAVIAASEGLMQENEQLIGTTDVTAANIRPQYQGPEFDDTQRKLAESGDVNGLLRNLLDSIKDPEIKQVLRRIRSLNLKTKIKIEPIGQSGIYNNALTDTDPDTIFIDPEQGMNAHTFIHEAVHAAISNVLSNPNHPLTKQFQKFFISVQDRLGAAYGATDLQEFAAELTSNPSFQAILKTIKTPKSDSMFTRIIRSIAEFFGFADTRVGKALLETTAFSRGVQFLNDAIDITNDVPPTEAEQLFLSMGKNISKVISKVNNAMPAFAGRKVEETKNFLSNLSGSEVQQLAFNLLRLDNIYDMYKKELPSTKMLLDALEKRVGQEEKDVTRASENYKKFVKVQEQHAAAMRVLNDLAIDISDAQVDVLQSFQPRMIPTDRWNKMSQKQKDEFVAAENKRRQEHAKLKQRFDVLPEEVKDLYKTIRTEYDAAFKRYRSILEEAAKGSPALLAKLREEFTINQPLAGYIPYLRYGDYWLEFTDPKTNEPTSMAFESIRERDQFVASELKGVPHQKYEKLENIAFNEKNIPPTHFLNNVVNKLRSEGASDAQINGVYQAYLAAFPAESIAKQFMKRKGTRGMERDIVRGYSDLMVRWSRKLANSEYLPQIDRALAQIAQEGEAYQRNAPDGAPAIGAAVKNIESQKEFFHNPTYNNLVSGATQASFFMYMAGNISSAIINLTSLPLMVYPLLTGKFGWMDVPSVMLQAGRTAMNDWSKIDKYKKLYETLDSHGQLKHTMAREILEGRRQKTEDFTGIKARIMDGLAIPFSVTERYNRGATAIAAFDLAIKNGMNEQQAIDYALETVKTAHTSGMAATGPKWMQNSLGRIFFTFKSFIWNSAYVLARAFYQAFKGEKPEIREAARRQLIATYGMATVFVGVKGMPFYGAVSVLAEMLASMFGDDDEPFDFNAFLRELLPTFLYKGLFNYVTNLEVANRAGIATDLVFRDDPRGVAENGYVLSAMQQAFGPVGSILVNSGRALELFKDGNYWRSIETLSPSFVRNGMKGVRYLNEGALTLKGDPVDEDIGVYNSMMQVVGFSPADLSNRYEMLQSGKGFEREVEKRRRDALRLYDMAARSGDAELMGEVRERIQSFNEKHPKYRITQDSLVRSRKAREAAEKDMIYGVRFNKNLRAEIKEKFFEDEE